ncbi:hydroxypyruvate isomerase [Anseongella ginsenosidimutans]|uniref:Hydroxypyruvate isomerase n=2 Tax=Anseongella ginsenosidimutans TaxID=496056 RepID=A0A4R3KQX3_9SPHI|nr:hydroxypyruvate isomerase [Anseongella ginsenosidimutans]
MAAGTAALMISDTLSGRLSAADKKLDPKMKGRINHSVCKWCFPDTSLEDLCKAGKELGLQSIELLTVIDFPLLQKYGLECGMVSGVPGGIPQGLNRMENHDKIVEFFEEHIPLVAASGFRIKNIICFSGNRDGMDEEEGLENCKKGLQRIMPLAEKHKVTVCMELLNSKVDHPDYMCDHTAWGAELAKSVGSESFKLLYDIYHMQIMEGDMIRTIRDNHQYIGHYHTAGVPGRNEIDESQEIYYPAVMRAIAETGFNGYVAQEFIPKGEDKLGALAAGIKLCDV